VTDLVPLKTLARNELEVSVLRSAEADEAPQEAMHRVAASLGVSASLMALSSTAGAASAAGIGAVGLVKSLLLGVGAGVLVGGTVLTASVMTEPSRASTDPKAVVVAGAAEPPTHGSIQPLGIASSAPVFTAEPDAPGRLPAPASPRASGVQGSVEMPPPASSSSIADEVAELDRARALLSARKPNDALRVLDAYAVRWPGGVMGLEASVVRVEVELALGNKVSAERHAHALIASHPNTGHARKVTSLLERANEE
jgi:hypothetical protein